MSITLWYVCIFLKWFCIDFVSLYGFSFSHFLNKLFYVCEFFCASFANHCEFLDSLQPLCNNSFFPIIFVIVVLSLLSVFCSFAVIFDHFVVLVEYFYVTFGSLCGRFTHHSQPIFHNIWESFCSLSSFLWNCAFPILGTLFGGTFVPVSNYLLSTVHLVFLLLKSYFLILFLSLLAFFGVFVEVYSCPSVCCWVGFPFIFILLGFLEIYLFVADLCIFKLRLFMFVSLISFWITLK